MFQGHLRRGYARLACVEAIEGQLGRGNLVGVWQGQSEENSVWKLFRGVSGVQPGEYHVETTQTLGEGRFRGIMCVEAIEQPAGGGLAQKGVASVDYTRVRSCRSSPANSSHPIHPS